MEKAATYTPEINGEPVIKKHRLMSSGSSPHRNGLTPVRQRLEQQRKKLLETESQGPQEISAPLSRNSGTRQVIMYHEKCKNIWVVLCV